MAGQLTLSNISAQFIKDKELIGKQDPYLIFDCGGQQVTTNAIKSGGTDCVWTESYTVPKAGNVIKVTAYNKNTLRPDSLLGVGELQLSRVSGGSTRFALLDKSGNEAGEVRVNVSGAGIGSSGTTGMGAGQTTGVGAGHQGVHHGVGGAAAGTGVAGAVAGAAATHHTHTQNQTAMGTGVGSGTTMGSGTDEYATRGTGVHQGVGTGMGTGVGTGVHQGVESGTHQGIGSKIAQAVTGTGSHQTGTHQTGVTGTHGVTTGTHTNEAARDAVCGREYFTKVEDRTVDKEEVIRIREHHPVEKQFVVETRPTGTEREQTGAQKMETLDRTIKVVGEQHGDPCSGVPTGQVRREV